MTYVIFDILDTDKEINMKRLILILVIAAGLIGSLTDYFYSKYDSYNRYLSGEYYFLYEAATYVPGDPNYIITPDDPMFYADYSDPKNMLMINSLDVNVCNYHDGFCTVIYGENVIEDFPASRIRLLSEGDAPYFYGTKQYTYEEYINLLGSFKDKGTTKTYSVSDKEMLNYRKILPYTVIITIADVILLAAAYFFRHSGENFVIDIILLTGAGFNILFNIVTWSVY